MKTLAITRPAVAPDARFIRVTPSDIFWARLRRNRGAVMGGVIVFGFISTAILAPWIAPHDPVRNDLANALVPPGTGGYLLGTDNLGRDQLSRIIHGSRISLSVGLVVQGMAVALGTAFGLLAGYYGGVVDDLVSGITNILFAFPRFLFALAIIAVLGPSLFNVFLALGVVSWPTLCRLVRAETLALKAKDFVEAARAAGASHRRIIVRHVLPNCLGPIVVVATLGVAGAILSEASLSFLGLGTQPPAPSWGSMLSRGRSYVWSASWLTVFPGMAIFLTVLGLNLLGDGIRDALDPRLGR